MVEEPIKEEIVDEDESFLEIEESLIEESILYGAFQQSAESVAYKIDNLYANEDSGRYRNSMSLKRNPPILSIADSKDNTVEFILTPEFTKHIVNSLNEVNRAYNGYVYKVEENKTKNIVNKFKSDPVKHGGWIIALLIILGLVFSQFI